MEKLQLTPKQKKFFKEPKGMYSIWQDLFNGDAFAANNFQNWALTHNLIHWNGSRFELPNK